MRRDHPAQPLATSAPSSAQRFQSVTTQKLFRSVPDRSNGTCSGDTFGYLFLGLTLRGRTLHEPETHTRGGQRFFAFHAITVAFVEAHVPQYVRLEITRRAVCLRLAAQRPEEQRA